MQDFVTLKKGFNKLRDKHEQAVADVSALENELRACKAESEEQKAQVAALQSELDAQTETMEHRLAVLQEQAQAAEDRIHEQAQEAENRIASAVTTTRSVRIDNSTIPCNVLMR